MPTALPASSDFTGAGVTEGDFKSSITALRDFLSGLLGTDGYATTALATLGAAVSGYVAKTTTYAVQAGDKGKLIGCTGTWSLALLAAATAGDGFNVSVRNNGTGVITVDPNLSETIDGGATLAINAGESLILYCNGAAWFSVGKSSGVPSGSLLGYGGSSAPAGWLLCDGSAVSRTTYASLFSAISTTFGVGDGSSTFNIPDLRGRVVAGKDDMGGSAASRLTSGGSGVNGSSLGAVGGDQRLHAHSHAVTGYYYASGSGSLALRGDGFTDGTAMSGTSTAAGAGSSQNIPPTLVANYIIKT